MKTLKLHVMKRLKCFRLLNEYSSVRNLNSFISFVIKTNESNNVSHLPWFTLGISEKQSKWVTIITS